ncbi:MAG: N-formylglutamate amidohydrolase [Vulcanimicrobiota bacterium]
MKKLPFAISIPHGGTDIPAEFQPYLLATPECMVEDVDHLTREICGVHPGLVVHYLDFSTSRTFVDLNRPPDWVGEKYPDGVVKRMTHLGRPVFREFPSDPEVRLVLDRLYYPYHNVLRDITQDPGVKLTIDIHSMAARGLPTSPDAPGRERPPICLGHRGGTTATLEMVQTLLDVMSTVYEVSPRDIWVDNPFNGGYITKQYGSLHNNLIQIEFSRGFYMPDQAGRPEPELPPEEIVRWRERFEETLRGLANTKIFR